MKLIFRILSLVYISAIFALAGSPVVQILAPFNLYSLLHIPLYGILTFLLVSSFMPMDQTFDSLRSLVIPSLIPGVMALGVGIADEIHQASTPGRHASVTDILLDVIGILFALLLVLCKKRMSFILKMSMAGKG